MKTFKTPNWDSDDGGDRKYQDMLKGTLNKKRKDRPRHIPVDDEKNLKLKKLLKKQFKDMKSNDVNVITVQTKIELGNAQKRGDFSSTSSYAETERKIRKKCKKSKAEMSTDSDSEDEREKKLLKKYSSFETNSDSIELSRELMKEKKRQMKLKKKLEKAAKKQMLLSKAIEEKIKDKLQNLQMKKLKQEQMDRPGKSYSGDHRTIKKERERQTKEIKIPRPPIHDTIIPKLEMLKKLKYQEKLRGILNKVEKKEEKKEEKPIASLRQKMLDKLKAARFRFLNEQIYKTDSKEAQRIFKSDPEAFIAYHEGYRQQVQSWPVNPLDIVIASIRKMPRSYIVADFGCGEAKLSMSVAQQVHSFDLVAVNDSVVACDMTKVPLAAASIDIAVFCLSLMGTNLHDYILEANRVLTIGGTLKIAEVESRFEDVDNFIEGVEHFGFKNKWKDLSHNMFYFMDFQKVNNVKDKKKLPTMSLLPCLYKKR